MRYNPVQFRGEKADLTYCCRLELSQMLNSLEKTIKMLLGNVRDIRRAADPMDLLVDLLVLEVGGEVLLDLVNGF